MSLQKLIEHLDKNFFNPAEYKGEEIYQAVLDFKKAQDEEYKTLKTENKLTFGKFRGFTIKELTKTMKGKDYCRWLLKQEWFTEKFDDLIEEMAKYNIKKN